MRINKNYQKNGFLKQLFVTLDEKSRGLLDKSKWTHPIYERIILSLETAFYQAGNYKIIPSFKKELDETIQRYHTDYACLSSKFLKNLEKDIVKAHLCYHVSAEEYFLYDFEHQDYWQRWEWLSDKDRLDILLQHFGENVFEELTDKSFFYNLAKDYFHRDVCVINDEQSQEDFQKFTKAHSRFIVKPIGGTMGADTFVTEVKNEEDVKNLYQQLKQKGDWMIEQLIVQHPDTASWNESSVNTLRIPSFRTNDGVRILQPFFRTGRKGSVVDNAGHGGIFAVFDPETGIITTDGVDEHGGRFEYHPDSQKKFKGWQIPRWEELKALVKDIHHSLPAHHRYVGFDLALDKDGQWVLIEGNWGQMVGQMAELKGIRKEFIEYIS